MVAELPHAFQLDFNNDLTPKRFALNMPPTMPLA